MPRAVAEIKTVRDRRYRAVSTCTVCGAVLAQGPEASNGTLAAFALGLHIGARSGLDELITRIHLGPGCPGGSIRLSIEELRPAPAAAGASS